MPDAKHRQMELMLAPAQEKLIGRDAATLCRNAGALLDREANEILLSSMGETVRIRLPDYVITQELDMRRHLTLLQYIMEGGRHISQCRPPVFSSKEDD